MTIEMKLIIATGVFCALVLFALAYWRLPKRLKHKRFAAKWLALQANLKDHDKWSDALLSADGMLDQALKRRKFKGGSMGERMVSAQRYFTNNDDIWFAHNLCKKLRANQAMKLKEDDVKDALIGFRQGLRDLGALDKGQSNEK